MVIGSAVIDEEFFGMKLESPSFETPTVGGYMVILLKSNGVPKVETNSGRSSTKKSKNSGASLDH